MSDMSFCTALRNDRAAAIKARLDAGSTGAVLVFYTAPQPASGAALTTQTHLGDCVMSKPCGSVAGGTLSFAAIANGGGLATGDAAWCRVSDGDGAWVMDLRVSDATGTAPVKIGTAESPSTRIYAGGLILVSSAAITEGNL